MKQSVRGTYIKFVGIVRFPGNTQSWLIPSYSKNFKEPSMNITQRNSLPLTPPKFPLHIVKADFCSSYCCKMCNFDCSPRRRVKMEMEEENSHETISYHIISVILVNPKKKKMGKTECKRCVFPDYHSKQDTMTS